VEELTSLRQENAALEQRAAALEAGRLVRQAEPAGELRLAFGEFHGEGKEFLRRLADAVKEEEKLLLAAVNHGEKGMQWVIAAGPETGFDFNTYRHDLLKPIAGKGGGKAPVWQGVGENPAGISEFRRLIREKAAGGE
jgi:alanyl-tRNA synthetase